MKRCLDCKIEKELIGFNKNCRKKDGLEIYCKECRTKRNKDEKVKNPNKVRKRSERYREKNREKLREKSTQFFQENKEKCYEASKISYHKHKGEIALRRKVKRLTEDESDKRKRFEQGKKWRESNKEKSIEYVKQWMKNNKEKHSAHGKVYRAIKLGRLQRRESCDECMKMCKTEAHHEDYKKPLAVVWLCRTCHSKKGEKIKVVN